MSILIGFLYVLEVIVCLLLVLVVMLQKPKEGGLSTAVSGGMGEAVFGELHGLHDTVSRLNIGLDGRAAFDIVQCEHRRILSVI